MTSKNTFKGLAQAAAVCMIAGLVGCGGGGGSTQDDQTTQGADSPTAVTNDGSVTTGGTTSVGSNYALWLKQGPGTLVRTGDASGFPVHAAFANLWKSGYGWMFTLQSANGMSEALTLRATPAARGTTGDLRGQLTMSSMIGGGGIIMPAEHTVVEHQYSNDLFFFLEVWSGGYCLWNGVAEPDFVDVSGGKTVKGTEATFNCWSKQTQTLTSIQKHEYEASLNDDGSLKYVSKKTSYDASSQPTGAYTIMTYRITTGGVVEPVSMDRNTVSSSGSLRMFGYGRVL